jgi:uncharacterized protein (DUF305 family)
MHQGGDMNNSKGDSSQFSNSDLMFAQMMIPHHQQAIEMSELAQTSAADQRVKDLAAVIASEQGPEIEQMKSWLEATGTPSHVDHDMSMGGMVSEAQMAELSQASGAEFDRLFLELMILHHEGAIDMAQMILDSDNAEVRRLGEAIVASQTEQIGYIESLLAD